MSPTARSFFATVIAIIVGFILLRWVFHLAISILMSLVPLALVVGGVYVAYRLFGGKALSGGRRTLP